MSRLLFAAARGARIEMAYNYGAGTSTQWADIEVMTFFARPNNKYRIHPADTHLQYGLISSQYRKMAEDNVLALLFIEDGIGFYDVSLQEYLDFDKSDELTRSLFLLFLAEALADEGM